MGVKLYDLTNPQKSIWLTEQFYKGKNINNICATLTIKEKINISKLCDSINFFIRSNKSFGIKIKVINGKPKQYFSVLKDIPFKIFELNDSSDVKKLAEETANEIFNIETDNLFKFKVFHLKNNYGGFVVMLHHLIGDAGTMSLVAKQIIDIYSHLINRTRSYSKCLFI